MANRKLGRNEPCWCGSGKKFKKCHLERANMSPVPRWEAARSVREAFSQKRCLAPEPWQGDCTKKIVKAHTVPKSGSLKQIAREGHVYSFVPSLENLTRDKGVLKPQSFGVKKASTFTGFCTAHDDALFSPLEKEEFAATPQQCFLLLYRALARELYTKEASASLNDQRAEMDRGRDPLDQATIQTFMGDFSIGVNAGVRDNAIYKSTLDAMLVQDDYTDIRAYVIDLAAPPPVMCSGAFYPEQDFTGRELQDVADVSRTPDLLAVTSFYGGARGHVAFVWTESRSAACAAFIDSLDNLGDAEVTSALVRFFFEHFENIHLQPDWWQQLSEDQRASLIKRMTDSANPFAARPAAILADDHMRIPSWGLIGRRRLA